jgi:hypothetical protein
MRYLITLTQDSNELASISQYCQQYHMDLRAETWYMDTHTYQFHVLYSNDIKYVVWLQLQYPNRLIEF